MFVVTASQMQAMDAETIQARRVPGIVLMEHAGELAFRAAAERLGDPCGKRVVVVCGKGNNGGDGFVIARHLLAAGAGVSVFLAAHAADVKGDARLSLDAYTGAGGHVQAASDLTGPLLQEALERADLVVDALLGTGLDQPLRGTVAEWVAAVNGAVAPILAVDLPSGIHSDTGEVLGDAVRADLTVTFGCPKRGHFLLPGLEHTGELVVADIGIPAAVVDEARIPVSLLTAERARAWLPERRPGAHKGSFGHVLVIGGSEGMTGAAALAATGALRAGAGLVTAAVPASLNDIMEVKLTEAMTLSAAETDTRTLAPAALEHLLREAAARSVCVLGPGISRHPETQALVRDFVRAHDGPLVLDADGLNAWAGHMGDFPKRPVPTILTPHPGELARLTGRSASELQRDRIGAACDFAHVHDVTLVLKGAHTIIADPYGHTFINGTGNAALASGGTGDVLAGVIGALLGQGLPAAEAAALGVFLHGLAADLWAEEYGPTGLTAGPLAERIPAAMARLERHPQGIDRVRRVGPLPPPLQ